MIARCAVQSPAGNKSKHTQSRKQIYSFKSLGQASTSLSHRTNVNAVDKKVQVCAGIRYKGLRGQRKRSLLRSWAGVEQAAILESGSRCPVAPPSVRALKPLAFGARLEGREARLEGMLHICSKTPAKVYRGGKHWSTPQIQKVPSVEG